MRLREALLLAAATMLLAGACSRLTFVKPNAQRKGADHVAPEYSFKETAASKRRTWRSSSAMRRCAVSISVRVGMPSAAQARSSSAWVAARRRIWVLASSAYRIWNSGENAASA